MFFFFLFLLPEDEHVSNAYDKHAYGEEQALRVLLYCKYSLEESTKYKQTKGQLNEEWTFKEHALFVAALKLFGCYSTIRKCNRRQLIKRLKWIKKIVFSFFDLLLLLDAAQINRRYSGICLWKTAQTCSKQSTCKTVRAQIL